MNKPLLDVLVNLPRYKAHDFCEHCKCDTCQDILRAYQEIEHWHGQQITKVIEIIKRHEQEAK